MSLLNLDFINICHGINNTRIYRKNKEFFAYTVTVDEIIPFGTKSVKNMSNHILKMVENSWSDVNLSLNYKQGTYNKRKIKKLNKLLKEKEMTYKNVFSFLIFLI
jgi:hypothetical protein